MTLHIFYCLFSELEKVEKDEEAAVVKPEGKKPEFVLKIKTQTVSTCICFKGCGIGQVLK